MEAPDVARRRKARLLTWVAVAAPWWTGSCAPPGGGPPLSDPIFPADYRQTFVAVTECRNSTDHPAMMRVYVNSIGVDAYLVDADPLPVGTIVVKEEFAGTDCESLDELTRWSAMRKEPPGFDPADGDWRWQEVAAPTRRVTRDEKTTCLNCHTMPECLQRDRMCTEH